MAIYPKKSKDPTEVALSAIQDALNVRDPDPASPIAATMATAAEVSSESRKRAPRVAPAGRDAPLDHFLQQLDLRSKEPTPQVDTVRLMTIHGAKGAEANYVYVMGMAEDHIPSFQSIKLGDDSAAMEEERRNCFVAITRTKEQLTLSAASTYRGWNKQPSRFLREMELLHPLH